MYDPQHHLLTHLLANVAQRLAAAPDDPSPWADADAAIAAATAKDEQLATLAAIAQRRDKEALAAQLAAWSGGAALLPEQDRNVLHSALKAFKKSMKLTRLDDESRIGGGPMSGGRRSSIVGIPPPPRFAREVFDELVRQGRLRGGRGGIYEMPPAAPGDATGR